MRITCSCEWSDGGEVLTLCAAHQLFEAKRCTGFMRDLDGLRAALAEISKGDVCPHCGINKVRAEPAADF